MLANLVLRAIIIIAILIINIFQCAIMSTENIAICIGILVIGICKLTLNILMRILPGLHVA